MGQGHGQAEIALCVVLGLSRYLREKDHFERQYKKHLSKRLLASKAPNEGGSSRGGTCLVDLATAFGLAMHCSCTVMHLLVPGRTVMACTGVCRQAMLCRQLSVCACCGVVCCVCCRLGAQHAAEAQD
jgi:hypothetical protein